jgi:hypothetical protein
MGLAIEVRRHSDSGLLESFYVAELCRVLERAGVGVRREIGIPADVQG